MRIGSIRASLPAALLAFALLAAGCGDDSGSGSEASSSTAAPPTSAFPAAKGGTLEDVLASAQPDTDHVVLPAGKVYEPGRNRFGFGVFTTANEQVTDADVAIYAAPGPNGQARGPFPARVESLETKPQYEALTTSGDPDAAKAVYVANLDLDQPGEWRMVALIRQDDEFLASRVPSLKVGDYPAIPDVGDRAPSVHTPTVEDVGDIGAIDTRDPHDNMHDVDLADVLGERPVVLLFATPALCVSRVCGPVVDVAEQVKSEGAAGDAAFIHMEIYEDNDPNQPVRPQVSAYGLRTEPWLFVLDADGRVSTRIEGAFSAGELERALAKATR